MMSNDQQIDFTNQILNCVCFYYDRSLIKLLFVINVILVSWIKQTSKKYYLKKDNL